METNKCPGCSKDISEKDKKCPFCGYALPVNKARYYTSAATIISTAGLMITYFDQYHDITLLDFFGVKITMRLFGGLLIAAGMLFGIIGGVTSRSKEKVDEIDDI